MKRTCCMLLSLILMLGMGSGALAAGGNTGSFILDPIIWDGATIGQCGLPTGYEIAPYISCCDETTCLGYPIHLLIAVMGREDQTGMMYYTGEQYLERVYSNLPLNQHKDGQLDGTLMIFQLKYHNAAAYCDAQAANLAGSGVRYWKSEDTTFYNSRLSAHEKEIRQEIARGLMGLGMNLDWCEVTAAQRVYTYEENGTTFALCMMAEVRAYQVSSNFNGYKDTVIYWDVPEYYMMFCPLSVYQKQHDTVFRIFSENTTVNDQFKKLNEKLNDTIATSVIQARSMQVAASMAYAQAMTDLTFSMVEGKMSSPTYSSDRFSDYLFDQNDYTLSDGSSVKISTSYPYVYEGDNGVVYYTDSALTVPGGATQLYPNR